MKKISEFLSENFQFLVVKFSIYLDRRVFEMPRQKKVSSNVCKLRRLRSFSAVAWSDLCICILLVHLAVPNEPEHQKPYIRT